MCLTVTSNAMPTGRIATKDIICYKVLEVKGEGTPEARVVSPYMGFEYDFGKLYKAEVEPEHMVRDQWAIEAGLHSFVTFEDVQREYCEDDMEAYIFVCVIPKGTRYWRGDFNDTNDSFASEALIVLDRKSARSRRYIGNLPSKNPRD